MDLLIKVYFKNERFPKGGQLTQYLHQLEIGERIKISGPKGKIKYLGNGRFDFLKKKFQKSFKKMSFVAGGTGITPMY